MSRPEETTTETERDAFFDDLLANLEKYKKKWADEARLEYPDMTVEQIEVSWDRLANQFGL
jgi:hypothetical protein